MLKSVKPKKNKKAVQSWTKLAAVQPNAPTSVRRLAVVYSNNSLSAAAGLAGIISASGVSAANDWTSLQALYQEARILGMKVSFCPCVQANAAALLAQEALYMIGTDRTAAAGVPTTALGMAALQNPKYFPLQARQKGMLTYEVRSVDLEDQSFTPTSSAPNPYRVFLWCQAATAATGTNTVIGITDSIWVVEWMVEFKGAL